jgi:hypothetical protein
MASIGDENAIALPPLPNSEKESVMQRRRFKQTIPLDQRLEDEAVRLRQEAENTPPGSEREKLIRRARHAETAAHLQEWLTSPGLQPPK